ncbi:MAG: hypothetical protein R3279_01385 [Putridiphycobacter sp.]|nr:hypothetical protein [Putridiphycobacter sp.]
MSVDIILVTEPHCRTYDWQSGNGVLSSVVQGGTHPYNYNWMDSTFNPISNSQNSSVVIRYPGKYFLAVTDAIGQSVLDSIIIADSINPQANFELNSTDFYSTNPFEAYEKAAIHLLNDDWFEIQPPILTLDSIYIWTFENKSVNSAIKYYFPVLNEHEYDTIIHTKGVYEVCLIEKNYNNCRDTICQEFSIISALVNSNENQFVVIPDYSSKTIQFHSKAFVEGQTLTIYSVEGQLILIDDLLSPIHAIEYNQAQGTYVYAVRIGDQLLNSGKFLWGF